jgi:hypothetical protein
MLLGNRTVTEFSGLCGVLPSSYGSCLAYGSPPSVIHGFEIFMGIQTSTGLFGGLSRWSSALAVPALHFYGAIDSPWCLVALIWFHVSLDYAISLWQRESLSPQDYSISNGSNDSEQWKPLPLAFLWIQNSSPAPVSFFFPSSLSR